VQIPRDEKLANLFNIILERLRSLTPRSTDGTMKVDWTAIGTDYSARSIGSGAAGSIFPVKVVTEYADYLACTTIAGAAINVAKPPSLAQSICNAAITLPDGAHTYSSLGVNSRTDTCGASVLTEYIIAPYSVNSILLAAQPSGGLDYTITDPSTSQPMVTEDVNASARKWWSVTVSNGVYQMTVVSESSDYISCTYNCPGNALNGTSANIAKPPELRGFTATTTDAHGANQEIYPPYTAGNTIFAATPIGGTGVTGVTLQDINVTPRVLATSLQTCESIGGTPTQKNRWFYCSPYF
jgi:hypothetical protein